MKDGESFEILYARLESISAALEEGGLDIAAALALYEEGVELARRCHDQLQIVEQRVEVLKQWALEPGESQG